MPRLERRSAVLAICLLAAPCISVRAMQDAAPDTVARIVLPDVAPMPTADAAAVRAPAPMPIAPAGVTRANATTDVRANATASMPRAVPWSNGASNSTMMIVGGVAVVVGALVGGQGGTMIMIGGGAFCLLGLWNYLH